MVTKGVLNVATIKELINPDSSDSSIFNVRMHSAAQRIIRKIYARFYPTKQKYNYTKLLTIAVILLDKSIKDKKIKANDDIAKKLGL